MEVKVHEREPTRLIDEFLAEVRSFLYALGQRSIHGAAFRLLNKPFIRRDAKSACAAGRVADRELRVRTGIGFDAADNRLDEDAWRKILSCTFLPFASCFFQQPFERRRLYVDIERGPLGFIDNADELLEIV
jgi:hypothetical protein